MGAPTLPADPRFATNPARVRHLDEIDGMVARLVRRSLRCAGSAALERHEVPFSKVYSIDDVLADPHFQARGAIIRLPDADLGSVPAPCVVPRFSGFAGAAPRTGPAVGEHNTAVFREMGVERGGAAALEADGVI